MVQNELNIIVCIKAVVLKAPKGRLIRSEESCEINPFDRAALECGFRLRGEFGGRVDVLSMGPLASMGVMREALAMGADRAVLLSDPALAGSDTLATATALSAAIKTMNSFDLILFGTRSADSDTGQVGPQTAQMLNLPFVNRVNKIFPEAKGLRVQRSADQFLETFEVDFPAALAIEQQAYKARDVGLFGIGAAFEDLEVDIRSLADIGLEPRSVGKQGSPTQVLSLTSVVKERQCEILTGEPAQQTDELINRLDTLGLLQ